MAVGTYSQNLTKVEELLKTKYLPALSNQISTEPSPFLEMIQKVPLQNSTITAAAPIGLNGGYGSSTEGSATPIAGAQRYKGFELSTVDMYVDLELSDKTVKLASSSDSAMLDAVDREVTSGYEAAKFHVGRALMGNGTGVLCEIPVTWSADSNLVTTIYVNSYKNIREGMLVDVYCYDAAADTEGKLVTTAGAPAQITGVSHTYTANNGYAVTLAGDIAAGDAAVAAASAYTSAGAYGFLTIQNSLNSELTGLGSIFDTTSTSIYGVTRASNLWINPIKATANDEDLDDILLYQYVKEAKNYKNGNIDLIMLGDTAFKTYQDFMASTSSINKQIVERRKFLGGATGYSVLVGSQEVVVVDNPYMPDNKVWGVDTKSFKYHSTAWDFATHQSSIFTMIPGTSHYRALLSSYGNLLCENPGGNFEISLTY